jgi:hypothetical protein
MEYHLQLFGPIRPPSTVRVGRGKVTFTAGHDHAAVEKMRSEFVEPIHEADYARLVNESGETIWESGSWDP